MSMRRAQECGSELAIPNPSHLKARFFRQPEVIRTFQEKELKLAPLCLDWPIVATRIAIQSNGQAKDLTARPTFFVRPEIKR